MSADELERRIDVLELTRQEQASAIRRIGDEARELKGRFEALRSSHSDLVRSHSLDSDRLKFLVDDVSEMRKEGKQSMQVAMDLIIRVEKLTGSWRMPALTLGGTALTAIALSLWVLLTQ